MQVREGFRSEAYPIPQAESILKTLQTARGLNSQHEDEDGNEDSDGPALWPWQRKS